MNLYKILFSYTGLKDQVKGLMGYLLARNDEHVYDYIDKTYNHDNWKEREEEENVSAGFDTMIQLGIADVY